MDAPWPLGAVELKVLDLEREGAFYESFGLTRITGDPQHAVFGADGSAILRLTALPGGHERPRHTAGLYHFAILLPSAQELGGFLQRTLEERLPLTGTADHFVSQALYFDDPEGNGIEVYADRPRTEWQYPNGRLNIGTDHLDFERLLRGASPSRKKFSEGTVLGHVHLNVGDLDASQAFLRIDGHGADGSVGQRDAVHELGGLPPSSRDQPARGPWGLRCRTGRQGHPELRDPPRGRPSERPKRNPGDPGGLAFHRTLSVRRVTHAMTKPVVLEKSSCRLWSRVRGSLDPGVGHRGGIFDPGDQNHPQLASRARPAPRQPGRSHRLAGHPDPALADSGRRRAVGP